MRTKHKLTIIILGVLLLSCSQEDSILYDNVSKENLEKADQTMDYHVSQRMLNQFLHVRGKLCQVTETKPIVENGDTLAFYVQFNHGWELISGDKRIPPILAESEEGQINWSDIANPGINSVKGMINVVREAKLKSWQSVNAIWQAIEPSQDENSQFTTSKKGKGVGSGTRGEGQGKWICVDTIFVENTTHSSKLIQTHWAQDGLFHEYKEYTPYKYNGAVLQHTKVGCVAVAAGQAINFMKCKKESDSDEIPYSANMPEVADGTLSVTSYTNNWSLLSQIEYVAKFISYLGKCIDMNYGLAESSSTTEKIRDLLDYYHISYQSCFSSTTNQYDYSTIYSNLLSGYPVIIAAKDLDLNSGHSFIIDGYRKQEWYAAYVYMWDPFYELTEWDVVFGDPTLLVGPVGEGGKEEEGDYSTYVHREVVTSTGFDIYFSMNWGWGNYSNEDNYHHLAYSSVNNQMPFIYNPNWNAGGYHFTYVRGMIYNLEND